MCPLIIRGPEIDAKNLPHPWLQPHRPHNKDTNEDSSIHCQKELTKPTQDPLNHYVSQARAERVKCHHNPSDRFFQRLMSETFDDFTMQKTIDPMIKIQWPSNYSTVTQQEKSETSDAKSIIPSEHHLIAFPNGSHLRKEIIDGCGGMVLKY